MTLEEASGITVALCLTHAVLDKAEWLAQRRLDLSYPVWGKPETLAYDRGAEYRGNGSGAASSSTASRRRYARPAPPTSMAASSGSSEP